MSSDMNLIVQAAFYEHLQTAATEREQHRRYQTRSRRTLNVRGRVGSMLVAVGQRMQTLDNVYAEPTA